MPPNRVPLGNLFLCEVSWTQMGFAFCRCVDLVLLAAAVLLAVAAAALLVAVVKFACCRCVDLVLLAAAVLLAVAAAALLVAVVKFCLVVLYSSKANKLTHMHTAQAVMHSSSNQNCTLPVSTAAAVSKAA